MRKLIALIVVMVLGGLPNLCRAQVTVRTVDLYGTAIEGVIVQVEDSNGKIYSSEQPTDDKGVATVNVKPVDDDGDAVIQVNLRGELNRDTRFIGRSKEVAWSDQEQFTAGFAVPLWKPDQVPHLADAVIRNPDHIAVAVQLSPNYGAGSRVIAEFDDDVDWWLENVLNDLPTIVDPVLARALFKQTGPGMIIPPHFDAAMRNVFDEVQRQNEATRACRMFPQGGPQQPAPQPPQLTPEVPNQNPPPVIPPQFDPIPPSNPPLTTYPQTNVPCVPVYPPCPPPIVTVYKPVFEQPERRSLFDRLFDRSYTTRRPPLVMLPGTPMLIPAQQPPFDSRNTYPLYQAYPPNADTQMTVPSQSRYAY